MDLLKKLNGLFSTSIKRKFYFLFILMLIGGMFETLGIGLIVPFISIVTQPNLIYQQPILHYLFTNLNFQSSNTFLMFIIGILLIVYLVKTIYLLSFYFLQYKFISNQQVEISRRLFKSYLTKEYTFHLRNNSADLLRNINGEVTRLFDQLIIPLFLLLSEIVVMLFVVGLLFYTSPYTTLISFLVFGGGIALFFRVLRKKLIQVGLSQQQSSGQMIKWINQGLGASKEVKVYGKESFFVAAFVKNSLIFVRTIRYYRMLNQVPRIFIETIVIMAVLIVVMIIILQGKDTSTILSTMSLFAMAAFRLMPSITRIVNSLTQVKYNISALDVVYNDLVTNKFEDYASLEDVKVQENRKLYHDSIQLLNVSYKYPGSTEYALSNINLEIPIGKSVAFIGQSGAGKTTIVDILLGLLEPTTGKVLVDKTELNKQLKFWRSKIGYIPQNIYLSDDSIRHNIAFGVSDELIDDSKVWKALEAAQLKQFVNKLPEQLNAFVGERGVRLSGGQKQRIGIARALYHDPEILFLDEATSALDNNTEKEIMKVFDSQRGNKTMIIIAHRLSTIENCDIVFEVHDGKITSETNKK